jgi:hypothetical protein
VEKEGLTVRRELPPDLPPPGKFVSPAAGEWEPDLGRYAEQLRNEIRETLNNLRGIPSNLDVGSGQSLPGFLHSSYKGVKFYRGAEIAADSPRLPEIITEYQKFVDEIETKLKYEPFKGVLKEVRIFKQRNPQDPYWEQEYNWPGFRSAFTGGFGQINSWEPVWARFSAIQIRSGLAHEFGHCLATWVTGGEFAPNEWAAFTQVEGWTSTYSRRTRSIEENFADTVKYFLLDGAESPGLSGFPQKVRFIREVLGGSND